MKKLMLVFVSCVLFSNAFAQGDSTQRKMVPPDVNDNSINNQDRRNSQSGTSDTTGRSGRSNNASDMKNDPMYNQGSGSQGSGTNQNSGTQGSGTNPNSGNTIGTGNQGHGNTNHSGSQGNSQMGHDNNANHPVKVNPTQDGVMIMDGKVVVIKNGQQSRSTEPVNLLNGSRILDDGTLVDRDGTRTKLKEGDYLDFSGKYLHRNPGSKTRNSSATTPVTPATPADRNKDADKDKNKDIKKDKSDKTMYLVPDSTVKDIKKDND